jgi:regulatory protein
MDDIDKYLNKALHFLSYRSRSEKEITAFLQKHKTPQDISEKVVTFLKEHKFVNDEEFARLWIESRLRARPKAIRLIRLELKQKGISQDTIEDTISNLELTNTKISDLESAKKLVEKKIDKYKHLSKNEIYQKLGGFLARRGFNWDTIKEALKSES